MKTGPKCNSAVYSVSTWGWLQNTSNFHPLVQTPVLSTEFHINTVCKSSRIAVRIKKLIDIEVNPLWPLLKCLNKYFMDSFSWSPTNWWLVLFQIFLWCLKLSWHWQHFFSVTSVSVDCNDIWPIFMVSRGGTWQIYETSFYWCPNMRSKLLSFWWKVLKVFVLNNIIEVFLKDHFWNQWVSSLRHIYGSFRKMANHTRGRQKHHLGEG